ncbi:hypothetical protein MIND_01362000 [Mycena indigotica]|uniref:Transmembrane protein n=1 Tax=Mycena indigotica TaxID=2126181 RepID=A0A8H6VS05_9AGAR|nr:uncharacterized protein MIND_01362000 [Mycena indigotica]KAF7289876.1 hypothetical protein MIND_01362000 [Mycena indigotica]
MDHSTMQSFGAVVVEWLCVTRPLSSLSSLFLPSSLRVNPDSMSYTTRSYSTSSRSTTTRTTPTSRVTQTSRSNSSFLSTKGVLPGIVIGVLVLIAILLMVRRRMRRRTNAYPPQLSSSIIQLPPSTHIQPPYGLPPQSSPYSTPMTGPPMGMSGQYVPEPGSFNRASVVRPMSMVPSSHASSPPPMSEPSIPNPVWTPNSLHAQQLHHSPSVSSGSGYASSTNPLLPQQLHYSPSVSSGGYASTPPIVQNTGGSVQQYPTSPSSSHSPLIPLTPASPSSFGPANLPAVQQQQQQQQQQEYFRGDGKTVLTWEALAEPQVSTASGSGSGSAIPTDAPPSYDQQWRQ